MNVVHKFQFLSWDEIPVNADAYFHMFRDGKQIFDTVQKLDDVYISFVEGQARVPRAAADYQSCMFRQVML